MPEGALHGIRVLDLATSRAELAGRVLAELGCEVIKVEPPGGAEARQRGPFEVGREGDPEASLYWATVGLGKHSVVLDAFDPADAERIRTLAAGADIFIESFDPGTLASVGLDYDTLSELNPALIYASVTPFGQDGPLAAQPATDLTLEAASGLIGLQGDFDRPPIPVGYPQASFHAGVQAAADITIALHERLASGLGQHLDVSAHIAMVWTLMNATGFPPLQGCNMPGTSELRGDGPPVLIPGLAIRVGGPCQDGYVLMTTPLPHVGERTLHAVMHWAESEGGLAEELCGQDWSTWIGDLIGGKKTVEQFMAAQEASFGFLESRTKRQIQDFAVERGVLIAPVYTVKDLRDDPHLAARDFWTDVGGRTHLGPFARLSKTPLRMDRPAPALGADQALVDAPARSPLAALAGRAPGDGALAGIKVADFAWVAVGPLISKALADHGAEVVHVESEVRVDMGRQLPPYHQGVPGPDRAFMFANWNTSKRGIAINLGTDPGQQVARRLADWADVVVESFTPGTMKKLGLDYATLSAERPELVMLSTCMRGQTGPEAGYTGFGNQGASVAGMVSITGWPDRLPVGPWGAYTDFITPRYGVAAITSALIHCARTGEGQYIDVSQIEAGMRFLEPLALDYTTNGRVAGPAGHDSLYACPHGVYACAGVERYVAIAAETPEQWQALRKLAPLDEFGDPALDALGSRLAQGDAIEERLRSWCREQTAETLAERLRAGGVPAYLVTWSTDLHTDPQLAHREHFVTLDHAEMGPQPFDGLVTRFSRTPGRLRSASPKVGQHTFEVLKEVLGLSDDEIADLAAAEALS